MAAVSTGDHKQAALFFDYIIPLHSAHTVPSGVRVTGDKSDNRSENRGFARILRLFGQSEQDALTTDMLSEMARLVKAAGGGREPFDELAKTLQVAKELARAEPADELIHKLLSEASATFRNFFTSILVGRLRDLGGPAVPVFDSRGLQYSVLQRGASDAVELTLLDAQLVDTTSATWEQILQLRAGTDSKRKLRNFRLFLFGNYQGKSPAYIQDDLDRRIEEYECACRKHGLQLVKSVVSCLLDSKSLLGMASIAVAGILLGNPAVVSAAALGGGVIETSRIAIRVASEKYDFESFKNNHELSYVFEARKQLEEEH